MRIRRIAFVFAAGLLLAGPMGAEPNMDEMAAAPAEPTEGELAPADGEVTRSTFTSAVVEREPLDELRNIESGTESVAYFTELRGMEGQTVIHRWEYDGEVMGEVAFDVAGPRWRVHSTKQLDPNWTGAWTVKVLDVDGNLLSQDQIDMTAGIAAVDDPEVQAPAAAIE